MKILLYIITLLKAGQVRWWPYPLGKVGMGPFKGLFAVDKAFAEYHGGVQ